LQLLPLSSRYPLLFFDLFRSGFFALQEINSYKALKLGKKKQLVVGLSLIFCKKFTCYALDHNCCICIQEAKNSKITVMRKGVP